MKNESALAAKNVRGPDVAIKQIEISATPQVPVPIRVLSGLVPAEIRMVTNAAIPNPAAIPKKSRTLIKLRFEWSLMLSANAEKNFGSIWALRL